MAAKAKGAKKPATAATRAKSKPAARPSGAAPTRTRKPRRVELKTKVSDASVPGFLASIADEGQRSDCAVLARMFGTATKETPRMWGGTIVGYGEYSYVGRSGRAGEWFVSGFAPRKGLLTLYMLGGWEADKALLSKLGKHSLGKGCLYMKRLADVDPKVLGTLVADALKRSKVLIPKMMNGGMS